MVDTIRSMVKQTYCWVLGIGIFLILIGVGVFVQVASAHDARLPQQNLRVAEAINHLKDCVCHETTNESSVALSSLDRVFTHTLITFPESKPQVRVVTPVETRLIDAGQRILVLSSSTHAPQVTAAADDFLRIYEQHRTMSSPTADQLTALDNLEYWLQILENQAQTTRWNINPSTHTQPVAAAWITTVSVSPGFTAALSPYLSGLTVLAGRSTILHDGAANRLLGEVIFGVHRRGPPVGAPIGVV